ncbi:MAG: 16S rRNA (guanine(966)-N(2))-methyltransferase RsmD [Natronincolaceae bacterium]|jgi:16S rRNA (guanine966-N2)-methyltransferase|nr:16S rRNA (guanine(966)-N(2))-methyltransferase RsmD [Bacillota bacterium]NLK90128.1 16S rRNA (guanine(966)-N(2))-methyltransferase RsmD [Clostridiales bacterium]
MRVISGKARGHTLRASKGLNMRPTADRVKESIFNIIRTKLCGSIVIDLFAGSGGLGIEALSRDADKAYFVDNNKNSIRLIESNLKKTGLIDNSEMVHMDVLDGIVGLGKHRVKADVIFLDPPYSRGFIKPALEAIFAHNILQPDGIIIAEHDIKDEVPDNVHELKKYRTNKYGNVAISFYRLGGETDEGNNLSGKL